MEVVKSFRMLTYIAIVSLITSVADLLPFIPATLTTWVSRGIMAALALCMFRLAWRNNRYKMAGVFQTVILVCSLVTSFFFGSYLLALAASVLSFLAVYQEYTAHSELIVETDTVLSRKWRNLFYWEFTTAILLSFGSVMTTIILMSSKLQVSVSEISGIVIILLRIPRFVVGVVYLLYLKKTIGCLNAN